MELLTFENQAPDKRPRSVTVIGWLFIAVGVVGLAYHSREINPQDPFESDALWVLIIRLLAIVAGAFMLRGANWARWFSLAWLAYHVILSAWHSVSETVTHVALLAGIAYVLFRPNATAYFRGRKRRPE